MPPTKKKKTADAEGLTHQIAVRVSGADHARLERLAVNLSIATLARAALLAGLDAIEVQPGILLGEKPRKRA